MASILVTIVFYKALLLQAEIWCWTLLALKGLVPLLMHKMPMQNKEELNKENFRSRELAIN